jgi:hypothetical protein
MHQAWPRDNLLEATGAGELKTQKHADQKGNQHHGEDQTQHKTKLAELSFAGQSRLIDFHRPHHFVVSASCHLHPFHNTSNSVGLRKVQRSLTTQTCETANRGRQTLERSSSVHSKPQSARNVPTTPQSPRTHSRKYWQLEEGIPALVQLKKSNRTVNSTNADKTGNLPRKIPLSLNPAMPPIDLPVESVPLAPKVEFPGVVLESDGGVTMAGERYAGGELFRRRVGPCVWFRSPAEPEEVHAAFDESDHRNCFALADGYWYQLRIPVPRSPYHDLRQVHPALGLFVLRPDGSIRDGDFTYQNEDAIDLIKGPCVLVKQPGQATPLHIHAPGQQPSVFCFRQGKWFELSPWIPFPQPSPWTSGPPRSLEVADSDVPPLQLETDGTFTFGGRHVAPEGEDIVAAVADGWVCSKTRGLGKELKLFHLSSGGERSYYFLEGQWFAATHWDEIPLKATVGPLYFLPSAVHVFPRLERFHETDSINCVCSLGGQMYAIHKLAGEREVVVLLGPDGRSRRFVCYQERWYEHLSGPTRSETVPEVTELPPLPEYPMEPWKCPVPMEWRPLAQSIVGTAIRDERGYLSNGLFPGLCFYEDGRLGIGGDLFPPGRAFELDHYTRCFRRGAYSSTVQLDILVRSVKEWTYATFRHVPDAEPMLRWEMAVPVDFIRQRFGGKSLS